MDTKINIYKTLSSKPFIYVELDQSESPCEFELYLNSVLLTKTKSKSAHYLFKIEESGTYYILAKNGSATFQSNEIVFYDYEIQSPKIDNSFTLTNEDKIEGENRIIDSGKGFYIEIKVKKEAISNLIDKIKTLNNHADLQKIDINTDSFPDWHSIHHFEYYKITQNLDKIDIDDFCRYCEQIDGVIYCSPAPITDGILPPSSLFIDDVDDIEKLNDIPESDDDPTPDFSELQNYLNEGQGMNIRNVWADNITGHNATVRHLDFGIYRDHEDFQSGNITVVNSRSEEQDCNHGTASTGCIAAADNGFGVTGIAHSSQFYFYDTGDSLKILEQANPGDIVCLDIQWNTSQGYIPAIGIKSWWDTIKNLTEKQVIVIMAAGNGNNDLSNTTICPDYGDSGGILVGACTSTTGLKRPSSNYGHYTSLINSWGHNVTTTGYGALFSRPGNNRNYTGSYSGTSSASPLCAGALALLQSYAKRRGVMLTPESIRPLIAASDYTEGQVDRIGNRPNVEQLMTVYDALILPPANVYPLPSTSNYINRNVYLKRQSYSEASIHFDYQYSDVTNTGIIAHYALEGPTMLEWNSFGRNTITLPVLNENGETFTIYLEGCKYRDASAIVRTINSCVSYEEDIPGGAYDLLLSFNPDNNKYLPAGSYKGVLPLYIKSWNHREYALPVRVNIFID